MLDVIIADMIKQLSQHTEQRDMLNLFHFNQNDSVSDVKISNIIDPGKIHEDCDNMSISGYTYLSIST